MLSWLEPAGTGFAAPAGIANPMHRPYVTAIALGGALIGGLVGFSFCVVARRREGAIPADADVDAARVVLRVDAEGQAWLVPGAGQAVAVRLVRWWRLPVLVHLGFERRAADGLPRSLLLGRDAMDDRRWRELNAWLGWLERGRHGGGRA